MSFGPKTLAEARAYNYGHFHKVSYREGFCIAKVWEPGRGAQAHQCCRKLGFGPDGAFCKQHDPQAEEERKKKSQRDWERKMEASPWRRLDKAQEQIAALERQLAEVRAEAAMHQDIAEEWQKEHRKALADRAAARSVADGLAVVLRPHIDDLRKLADTFAEYSQFQKSAAVTRDQADKLEAALAAYAALTGGKEGR